MGDWAEENWEAILAMKPLPDSRPECAVPGCPREGRAKGLCLTHYQVARAKFDEEYRLRLRRSQAESQRRRRARQPNRDFERMVAALGQPPQGADAASESGSPHWTEPEFWQMDPEPVEDGPGATLPDAPRAGGRPGATPPTPASPEGRS